MQVWTAECLCGKHTGEIVAIKLALKWCEAVNAVRDEQRAFKKIETHRNVMNALEFLKTCDGPAGIVMPLLERGSVKDYTAQQRNYGKPFGSPTEYLVLLLDVTKGLGHMHAGGLLHSDIKEANILLDDEGRAVLTDSGLCYTIGKSFHSAQGTPAYIAPELLCLNLRIGSASEAEIDAHPSQDMFALGVTAFGMLCQRPITRRVPQIKGFDGMSESTQGEATVEWLLEQGKVYQDLAGAAAREGRLCLNLEHELCRLLLANLQKCVHEDPQQRPAAEELEASLEALLPAVRAAEEVC